MKRLALLGARYIAQKHVAALQAIRQVHDKIRLIEEGIDKPAKRGFS